MWKELAILSDKAVTQNAYEKTNLCQAYTMPTHKLITHAYIAVLVVMGYIRVVSAGKQSFLKIILLIFFIIYFNKVPDYAVRCATFLLSAA